MKVVAVGCVRPVVPPVDERQNDRAVLVDGALQVAKHQLFLFGVADVPVVAEFDRSEMCEARLATDVEGEIDPGLAFSFQGLAERVFESIVQRPCAEVDANLGRVADDTMAGARPTRLKTRTSDRECVGRMRRLLGAGCPTPAPSGCSR